MPEVTFEQEPNRRYTESSSEAKSEMTEAEDVIVHPEFRLWITTRTDVGLPLPAVLIQSGIKLACEAQENFRGSVETNCRVVTGSLNNCVPVWGQAAANIRVKVCEFFWLSCTTSCSKNLFALFQISWSGEVGGGGGLRRCVERKKIN